MTRPSRTLAALAAVAVLVAGCHTGAAEPTSTPVMVVTSASPTPTPTPTPSYGPNQTAAMKKVTAYIAWISMASKDLTLSDFSPLNKIADGDGLSTAVREINYLREMDYHTVGDLAVASMVPDPESAAQIGVSACVDASGVTVIDAQGHTVPSADGRTRRAYTLQVKNFGGTSGWMVVSYLGGGTSC